jgi:hypothetical protein
MDHLGLQATMDDPTQQLQFLATLRQLLMLRRLLLSWLLGGYTPPMSYSNCTKLLQPPRSQRLSWSAICRQLLSRTSTLQEAQPPTRRESKVGTSGVRFPAKLRQGASQQRATA